MGKSTTDIVNRIQHFIDIAQRDLIVLKRELEGGGKPNSSLPLDPLSKEQAERITQNGRNRRTNIPKQ